MFLPHFTHIVKPGLKHIYLSLDEEGALVVKSSGASVHEIEKILLKKAAWITSAKEKFRQKKGRAPDFSGESQLYFRGERYDIALTQEERKHVKLEFVNGIFTMKYGRYDETAFHQQVDSFYRVQSEQYIPPIAERWSERMHLSPNSISFRKAKRQWGSCSSKNVLSFNTRVMKLPESVIEYVIVHELAHILHKHHQKDFWKLVERHMPDYRQRMNILRTYIP